MFVQTTAQRVVGVVDAQLAVFKAHQAVEQAATVGSCTNRYALLGTSTSKLIVKERWCSSCKYKVPLVVIYTSNEESKCFFVLATAFLSFSMSLLANFELAHNFCRPFNGIQYQGYLTLYIIGRYQNKWVIVPMAVVVQPRFVIVVLALKPDWVCPVRALFCDFALGFLPHDPGHLLNFGTNSAPRGEGGALADN